MALTLPLPTAAGGLENYTVRGTAPVRVCVEAKLAHHDFLIEVAVVAAR